MSNSFYNRMFNPLPGQRVDEQVLKDEFQRIQIGFDGVEAITNDFSNQLTTGLALKANLAGGNTWTGAQNFTGATMTIAAPTLDAHPANKFYVDQKAFQTALPNAAGNAGKWITTDGTNIMWASMVYNPADLFRVARTSNTPIGLADKGKWIDITSGTFTQTFDAISTLPSGWWCYLGNSGTGNATLDPNASETIDGLTSYVMYPNEIRLVQSDGTALRTIVLKSYRLVITGSTTFTTPPGYVSHDGEAIGGGGGGGFAGASYGAGGGGGGCAPFSIPATSMPTTVSVSVGTGGIGRTTDGVGNPGGNTTFGTLATGYGGGGGGFFSGTNASGGGGGGVSGAGGGGSTSASVGGAPALLNAASPVNPGMGGGSCAVAAGSAGGEAAYGGGAGGATSTGTGGGAGGASWRGGGGGGGGGNNTPQAAGGASRYAGAGGMGGYASNAGTAGTAPGGGGGGNSPLQATSYAGARGEVRIQGVK